MTTPTPQNSPQNGPHAEPARPLAERLAVAALYGMGGLTVLLALAALAFKTPA